MKVTFCTYDSPTYLGGPSAWIRRLLPDLRDLGVELEVLFFLDGTRPEACPCWTDLQQQGIPCYRFPMASSTEQKVLWVLSQLQQRPADVFVPQMLVGAFYASRWLKAAGIPTVGVLHSDDEFYRGVARQFIFGDPAYRLSAAVCVSEFLQQQVQRLGTTDTRFEQIACGVPLSTARSQPAQDRFRLIYVGRLEEEQKRISHVTQMLCEAARQLPSVEAVLFGGGSARSQVEQIIATSGQADRVRLGGVVDSNQIQQEILAAQAVVLLSEYEGLPVSLMEAMACGVVPICSAMRSGIPELVTDGVSGLIVGDRSQDFVAAVETLIQQPQRWQQLSDAAHQTIVERYSRDACARRWLDLLTQLHAALPGKRPIAKPAFLRLPPVDPGLSGEDRRRPEVLYRQVRKRLGAIRRDVFRTSIFRASL